MSNEPEILSPGIRALLDAFSELVVLIEANGLIVAANKALVSAAGEPLLGKNLFDLVKTNRETAAAYIQRCSGSRQPTLGALTFRTAAGPTIECRCEGSILPPTIAASLVPIIMLRCRAKSDAVSRFTLLNEKISELTREVLARQRAEEKLRELNNYLEERAETRAQELTHVTSRLGESERHFGFLVAGVTDYAIFMLNPAGIVASWNLGAEKIKGYTAQEIVGQHFSRFYTDEDRINGVPDHALWTAERTGRFEAEGWRVRKDGKRFWASVVIDAIRDDGGQLIGFAKITRDLTERRAADERLRQAQKMEAIGQLTGGVAHDFNNLLTVVGGNIENVARRLPRHEDELHRSLQAARRGVERAATLTHRLLAFSRQQPLDPKPIDMNRLIVGMSDLLSHSLGERVKIETVISAGLWQIAADPNQVENAILNLAVNARDAMPNGGKLTLETANTFLDEVYATTHDEVTSGQYVMLSVSDTGLGMSKDIVAKAFEPFFTTKKLGEGTGLGLSQVHGFVKQSGGHVKIYSEPGEGTTVRLYFPRVLPTGETEDIDQAPTIASPARSGEMILVVEDDDDVRALSAEILRELGYDVLAVADGDEALAALATQPRIRLLFTDIGLPGAYNGRLLADEASRRHPRLKILFTTGYARNAIIHQGRLDAGVNLIVKPFSYAGLAAKIRSVLEAH